MILMLSAFALADASVHANAASAEVPTILDCRQACEATNERVSSFKIEGGNAHCVCECKQGWSRKSPGAVCERQSTASQAPIQAFCKAKLQVSADERAIAQMNFGNDTQTFEMFAKVARFQKAKFEEKVLNALIDQGTEATTVAVMNAKSLNPVSVNSAIATLQQKGLNNEAIFGALRAIAHTKGKPAMAEAYKVLVHFVQAAREGYDTGDDMAEDKKNAQLRLLVGVLKVAQGNPELGLAVTAADFGESLAYLGYLSAKVSDLNEVTDNKLVTLNGHIARLKADVASLEKAKLRWAAANTDPDRREPPCVP